MDLSIKQSVVFPPSPNPSRSPFLRKHTGLHCPLFQADADMLQCHAMQHSRGEMPLITLRRLRRFGGKEEKGGWIGKQGGQRGRSTRLFVCPTARTAAVPAGEARELPQSATALLCNSCFTVVLLHIVAATQSKCSTLEIATAPRTLEIATAPQCKCSLAAASIVKGNVSEALAKL